LCESQNRSSANRWLVGTAGKHCGERTLFTDRPEGSNSRFANERILVLAGQCHETIDDVLTDITKNPIPSRGGSVIGLGLVACLHLFTTGPCRHLDDKWIDVVEQ